MGGGEIRPTEGQLTPDTEGSRSGGGPCEIPRLRALLSTCLVSVEQRFEPPETLGVRAAQLPEPPQRRRQAQAIPGSRLCRHTRRQGSPQVVVLEVQPFQPGE